MKNYILSIAAVCCVFVSCINTSLTFANRSNVHEYRQHAETDGGIDNKPHNTDSLAAEKTTEVDTAVSTSSGQATTGDKSNKKDSEKVDKNDNTPSSEAVKEAK